ncbi:phage terminase large subunit [Stenotrophomonas maltophilia]|uniref:phage terminase large subunit n=1 Tax=Stenotrophomonas maltophilia TaxID=40324 RepID=UPI0006AC5810|nr:phage terminase large subunit [Stenotrophomonas maltophilia]KOQ69974.1 phage terminase, large subunit [Stenotrophomonas maltophilia]
MAELTPQQRLVAAELAREDFYFFSRYTFLRKKGFPWMRARHHAELCAALDRVYRGECKRLVINLPPRYSKTELAVVNWIAWCLGKVPESEFIHISYAADLALNNSANTRELVQHEVYGEIFPEVQLRKDSSAKGDWRTTKGGVVYATGAGGTVTGFGAGKARPGFGGAIIIDDPHKPDEAGSDKVRGGVLDWFNNTLQSRVNSPETPIIVIMQRLHERDLAGWLLGRKPGEPARPGGNGEVWEHVCFRALSDEGDALWPEKHTAADLDRMREAMPYVFSGQYQQEPSPGEGGIIKTGKIETVDALPAGLHFVRGWDLAGTEAKMKRGDYTAGVKLGRSSDGVIYIADVLRERMGPDEVETAIGNTGKADMCLQSIPQDPGQAGKAQVMHLSRKLYGVPSSFSLESGDKVTRNAGFAAQVNAGNVKMLRAPWNDPLMNEYKMFPNGQFDDQVDASSRAFNALDDELSLFMAQAQ